MFKGCRAWFSASVEEDKIEKWRAEGGLLESYEVADFLFSADATHSDTVKIFESKAFCDGCLSVFHPDYISACMRHGGRSKVNIGRYDLPPEEVQNYMRSRGDRFGWEEEDTETSEELGRELDQDVEVFKNFKRIRANDRHVPDDGHGFEPNSGSGMNENLLCLYKRNHPEYYALPCENPDLEKREMARQKGMEIKRKQNTKLRFGSPLHAGVKSASNEKRADMSNLDAKAPMRSSPRRSSPRQHQNVANNRCTEIPRMSTNAQKPLIENRPHHDLIDLNIRAPKHMGRKQNMHRQEFDTEQAVDNETDCMAMKKLKGTRKSLGDAQKTHVYLESSEHTGNGVSTRSKFGVSESEQRQVVTDDDNEEDELMEELRDDSVHLLDIAETKRIQDLRKVSGRLQRFQVGKEGCKCIET